MTHTLKTWPEPFAEVRAMDKPFELRKNDRNYKTGDILILREYLPDKDVYTGEFEVRCITTVLEDFEGLAPGYCILGLSYIPPELIAACPCGSRKLMLKDIVNFGTMEDYMKCECMNCKRRFCKQLLSWEGECDEK